MINHGASFGAQQYNCMWYFSQTSEGAFIIKATKNIRRGDMIRESYGDKPSDDIFVNYGFYIDEISHVKRLRLYKDLDARSAPGNFVDTFTI